VNHVVLRLLNPEQVEVEIYRSEELDQRRGLSAELDEMWSFLRAPHRFDRRAWLTTTRNAETSYVHPTSPCPLGLKISKGRGECGMLGKGGRE